MQRLASRKLWISLIAGALVTFGAEFGVDLDPENLITLGTIVAAYVFGEAAVDRARINAEVAAGTELIKQNANAIIANLGAQLEEYKVKDAPSA